MARRRDEEKVLDVNATMQGSLVFSDPVNLRINGRFEGNLKAKGNLIIGERATVFAEIEGENIIISGLVRGKIKSTQIVSLSSTANVYADIHTPKISIEEGATFNGKCTMIGEKLSLEEVADFLSVDKEKVIEWVNNGRIPAQKEGNGYVFDRREVELWVEQNR
ncbi:MAG: polymer-forming cytoskeletal protein [Candidatus Omnitrophica bacterium]|nr:polymer-forming cytoskeletal protein [Candidatus Omnitrophota bacterium]